MSAKITLDQLLPAEPDDCGCAAGMLVVDELVEMEIAGEDPTVRFPGLVAHLRACEACRFDHDSLLALVRERLAP